MPFDKDAAKSPESPVSGAGSQEGRPPGPRRVVVARVRAAEGARYVPEDEWTDAKQRGLEETSSRIARQSPSTA